MNHAAPSAPVSRRVWLVVAALVALHLALVLDGARRHSAVFDEVVYPTVGYAHWTAGDYRMNAEHPPLTRLWTGAAWLGQGIDVAAVPGWAEGDQWRFGRSLLYGSGRPAELLFRARAAVAVVSAALAIGVFLVASRWGGTAAGMIALVAIVADPLVIAHAGLATTDMVAAALYFAAALAIPGAIAGGGWRRIPVAGVLTGLALAAKFSTLPLLVLGPIVLASAWLRPSAARVPVATGLARCGIVLTVAAAIVTATYGPAGPSAFWRGMVMLGEHNQAGHPSFAFGQYTDRGWWWYFPAAWAVKTPIPLLLGAAAGVPALWNRLREDPPRRAACFAAPALVLVAGFAGGLNLGVRHWLPLVPFLAVGLGLAGAALWRYRAPWGGACVILLGAWLVAGTVRVHPHELAYANEGSGGPDRLWRRLADSNLDWGQALPDLEREVGRHPLRRLYLGYFGTADPAANALRYCWIPSMGMAERRCEDGPEPEGREWIAISVTNLLDVYTLRHEAYAWLRERPIDALPGYSIALFDITGDGDAHRRLGETALSLGEPVAAIPPLTRAAELAAEDPAPAVALAVAFARAGRPTEAAAACNDAVRRSGLDSTRAACAELLGSSP